MTRRAAYLSVLKFEFHGALIAGLDRRAAYAAAKLTAARYAFTVSSHSLAFVSVEVW